MGATPPSTPGRLEDTKHRSNRRRHRHWRRRRHRRRFWTRSPGGRSKAATVDFRGEPHASPAVLGGRRSAPQILTDVVRQIQGTADAPAAGPAARTVANRRWRGGGAIRPKLQQVLRRRRRNYRVANRPTIYAIRRGHLTGVQPVVPQNVTSLPWGDRIGSQKPLRRRYPVAPPRDAGRTINVLKQSRCLTQQAKTLTTKIKINFPLGRYR